MMKVKCFMIGLMLTLGAYADNRGPLNDYISGDAFRSISNYIYEGKGYYGKKSGADLDPDIFNNSPGDIIFVQPYVLDDFIENIHPRLPNPYILITHNSDEIIDAKYADFLQDPKIIRWYSQNVDIDDEKIVPVPIGIENRFYYFKRTSDMHLIEKIASGKFRRSNFAYLNIRAVTFKKEREFVLDYFTNKSFIHRIESRHYGEYLRDLKEHRFCISPSGNGLDCHRTWEALYMGCIPIVRPFVKSTMKYAEGNDSMYKDLPVIVVKEWQDVTPVFLHKKLVEFHKTNYNYSKLYFPYWKKMILDDAERFKKK